MPENRCCVKRLSAYGKEVQKLYYEKRAISWAHYCKLMRKPKCWEYGGFGYGY